MRDIRRLIRVEVRSCLRREIIKLGPIRSSLGRLFLFDRLKDVGQSSPLPRGKVLP